MQCNCVYWLIESQFQRLCYAVKQRFEHFLCVSIDLWFHFNSNTSLHSISMSYEKCWAEEEF